MSCAPRVVESSIGASINSGSPSVGHPMRFCNNYIGRCADLAQTGGAKRR